MKVYKRTPGGNYYLRVEIHGKEIYQSLRTKDKTVARDRAKGIVAKATSKQFDAVAAVRTRNGSPTCGTIAQEYKRVAALRGLKDTTVRDSLSRFRRVVGVEGPWEDVRLHQLDENTIAKFVKSRPPPTGSPEAMARWKRTCRSALRQARAVFAQWAMAEYRRAGHNIPDLEGFMRSEGVSAKGVAKKYIRPPQAQVDKILSAARALEHDRPDLFAVFLLVYPLALRAGEAVAASLDWLDGYNGWTFRVPVNDIYAPKGARDRMIPVHPDVADKLRRAASQSGTGYFLAGATRTARQDLVMRDFSAWMRTQGWDRQKCAHELRALQGCRWFTEQGAEIAQMLLGHSSIQTTCQYYANYSRRPDPLQPDW